MLLRDELDKSNIQELNINIAAYQKMVNFYAEYEEKHGECSYVTQRVMELYGIMAEYMIAREIMVDKD